MIITKGIKVKLYLTDKEKQMSNSWFGSRRFTWNKYLDMLNQRYQNNKDFGFPSKYDLIKLLPLFKNDYPFLKKAESSSLQGTVEELYDSFLNFFNKNSAYPHFKSKKKSKDSITIKNNKNIELSKSALKIPKIGWVKARWSNNISFDSIQRITITKTRYGEYYASVLVKSESQALPLTQKEVGIDLGQTELAVFSDGTRIESKTYYNYEKKLKYWQKKLSRRILLAKEKGIPFNESKNVQKALKQVAKYHKKIQNCRKDYLHKLSLQIVKNYDFIAIEDLDIKNMISDNKLKLTNRNRKSNNHKISNQSWYNLRIMLTYKAAWYGKELVVVKAKDTTKTCFDCGFKNNHLTLMDRKWKCPNCGSYHDRDINAAKNILARAQKAS